MSTPATPTRHHKISSIWYAIQRLRAFSNTDLSFLSTEHQKEFYTALKIGNILEDYFMRKNTPYKDTKSSLDMSVHQAMKYLKKVYFSKLEIQ